MRFDADPAVFDLFPGLSLAVVIASGLDPGAHDEAVSAMWREAWGAAGEEGRRFDNAQSHPRVAPWRVRLRAAGAHPRDFPSSIEALLRRAIKGGEPFSVNPLVDAYNAVSLRHLCPAGAFDLDHVTGPIELRLTRPGDRVSAMDSGQEEELPAGEVAYTDGSTVLTRHFVWKQSTAALVGPGTTEAFLVSEVLGEVGRDVAGEVLADLERLVDVLGGSVAAAEVLEGSGPSLSWG